MMLGLKEIFEYEECSNCGCIQIKKYPADMNKYYPKNYYSFNLSDSEQYKRKGISGLIKRTFGLPLLLKINQFLLAKKRQPLNKYLPHYLQPLPGFKLSRNSRIIDIGCGSGSFLFELYKIGFSRLEGIDPYLHTNSIFFNGVSITKKNLFDLNKQYDLIMLHHTLEHMPDQHKIFDHLKKILSEKGMIILRIPVKNEAWKLYGENWVQLDAPRHFYIHSVESIKLLLNQHGLKIKNIVYDSWSFQFWGSELYKKNIPLYEGPNDKEKEKRIFSEDQIEQWQKASIALNKEGKGDQAIFYITHT